MADITRGVRLPRRPRNPGPVDLVLGPPQWDSFTKAMLHFNGTDGSTTFTDEIGNAWTPAGNAQIDTAQSVFGGSSGFFDGTGDYISTPDSNDWWLDDGSNANSWTIDGRLRFNSLAINNQGIIQQRVDGNNCWELMLISGTTLFFQVRVGGANIIIASNPWSPSISTWYHLAIVKNSTAGYMMFIDGTQIGSTQADTDVMPNFAGSLLVGMRTSAVPADQFFNGWIDELRISKGIARWTSNFTPPSSEYAPS